MYNKKEEENENKNEDKIENVIEDKNVYKTKPLNRNKYMYNKKEEENEYKNENQNIIEEKNENKKEPVYRNRNKYMYNKKQEENNEDKNENKNENQNENQNENINENKIEPYRKRNKYMYNKKEEKNEDQNKNDENIEYKNESRNAQRNKYLYNRAQKSENMAKANTMDEFQSDSRNIQKSKYLLTENYNNENNNKNEEKKIYKKNTVEIKNEKPSKRNLFKQYLIARRGTNPSPSQSQYNSQTPSSQGKYALSTNKFSTINSFKSPYSRSINLKNQTIEIENNNIIPLTKITAEQLISLKKQTPIIKTYYIGNDQINESKRLKTEGSNNSTFNREKKIHKFKAIMDRIEISEVKPIKTIYGDIDDEEPVKKEVFKFNKNTENNEKEGYCKPFVIEIRKVKDRNLEKESDDKNNYVSSPVYKRKKY